MKKLFRINLQQFAEKEVEEVEEIETEKEVEEEEHKFTQKELEEVISKRLVRERAKFEKQYEEKIKKEVSEAERLAKMTEQERAKAELEKEREEIKRYKEEKNQWELTKKAKEILSSDNVPVSFAELIATGTAEEVQAKAKALKNTWEQELQIAVEKRIAGKTPKEGKTDNSQDLRKFFGLK